MSGRADARCGRLHRRTRYEMIYAIDFDGTIVTHEFPQIGKPVPYALDHMRLLIKSGCQIILWTMRSGDLLDAAVQYLEDNGIELWGVNENPDQDWSESPKAYAHRYIDDAAVGCPLIYPDDGGRPYVDWPKLFPGVDICDHDGEIPQTGS